MPISPKKQQELDEEMKRLNLKEEEIEEQFILGSGRGGQKIQKTSSTVFIHHLPSGIQIKCQKSRFREENRYFARLELCNRIKELIFKEKSEKTQEQEKIRRQKRRRSRRGQKKVMDEKIRHSEKKAKRQSPSND